MCVAVWARVGGKSGYLLVGTLPATHEKALDDNLLQPVGHLVGGSGHGTGCVVSLLALLVGLEEGGRVSARAHKHTRAVRTGISRDPHFKICEIEIQGELDRTGSFERQSVD